MSRWKAAVVAALFVAISGCATTGGASFDRHQAAGFVPGVTTKAEVVAALGKPFSEKTYTAKKDLAEKELANPAVVSEIRYFHFDRGATGVPAGVQASRNAFYTFNAGKLMSWWVISTFPEDPTDFDEALASKLQKGKTTEAEIRTLLGRPAGTGIYPIAQDPQGTTLLYEVFLYRPANNQQTYKTLKLFLDRNHVLSDYDLNIRSR